MVKSMQEIPGPEPIHNPIRVMFAVRKVMENSTQFLMDRVGEYGDIYKIEFLDNTQIVISDPQMMREVLVTKASSFQKDVDYKNEDRGLARFMGQGILVSDGEFWKKQRKRVQPAFHTTRIREYAETMTQYTAEAIAKWRDSETLDINDEMMKLTLRIVARTIFDVDIDTPDNISAVRNTMEAVQESFGGVSFLPRWVPTPTELHIRRALADADAFVYDIIAKRRAEGDSIEDRGDLLSMLLLAEDDDGQRMSDKQVRDEAVTLLLAGHETTANTLNWTFYQLAQEPEAEAKLHEELDRVLGGRVPTLDDLKQLPYTEMVIKESMRLFPPVPSVGRQAIEDVQIGDYLIEKGTSVGTFWYATQRDPRYWDDPLAFKPERFSLENEAQIDRYTYMPFGSGARICVGSAFAMMEAHLLLAGIAQHFSLDLLPDVDIIPQTRVTMYPRDGLPMRVTQRQPVPADTTL